MHILFLSDNFPPEVNAPASRTFDHCREWVRLGQQVTVITCAPNFPNGEMLHGYSNKIWQEEYIDGVRVIRVWTFIAENSGLFKRVVDYVSFMPSSILAATFVRHVDIVVGTSPQLFAACAAYITGKIKRRPWVFELRDIWPASIEAVGAIRESCLLRYLEKLELFLYRTANLIITVSHEFAPNLVSRGVDAEKIKVITNGFDHRRFYPQPKDPKLIYQYALYGKFVAGYIGTHGLAHGLDTVLDTAKLLAAMDREDRYRIILIGDGAEKRVLAARAKSENIKNVIFIDAAGRDEIASYWAILDIAIVHLRRRTVFESVIPSKIYECMAMGIAILHGVPGISASIVKSTGIGVVFEPENAEALCNELILLSEDSERLNLYRKNALIAAEQYRRDLLASRMLDELLLIHEGKVTSS